MTQLVHSNTILSRQRTKMSGKWPIAGQHFELCIAKLQATIIYCGISDKPLEMTIGHHKAIIGIFFSIYLVIKSWRLCL